MLLKYLLRLGWSYKDKEFLQSICCAVRKSPSKLGLIIAFIQ